VSERIVNQTAVSLVETIEIMISVGGLSPAQTATFKLASERITELEKQIEAVKTVPDICNSWFIKNPNNEFSRGFKAVGKEVLEELYRALKS
jgi:hypothetical protein